MIVTMQGNLTMHDVDVIQSFKQDCKTCVACISSMIMSAWLSGASDRVAIIMVRIKFEFESGLEVTGSEQRASLPSCVIVPH